MRLPGMLAPLGALLVTLAGCAPATSSAPAPAPTPPPAAAAPTGPTPQQIAAMERRLGDWPNLARYREANAALGDPAPGENRVVFMGNSITDAWARSFPAMFPGKPYVGRGISGQTTPQMLLRFRQDVIELRPKVAVLLAGTNDIAGNSGPITLEEIGRNIASMAELARANGIKVVLSSVLPVSDTVPKDGGGYFIRTTARPPARILELNRWLRDYAAKNGHIYLDYYSVMADGNGLAKTGLTYDGLHPNSTGYNMMTEIASRAIERALGKGN